MVEPNPQTTTETRTERANPPAGRSNGEPRTFTDKPATTDKAPETWESVAAASTGLAEQGRRTASDIAASWQGAFEPLMGFQSEMNRWVDDFMRRTLGLGSGLQPAQPFAFNPAPLLGLPAADVRETQKDYCLCVEVPGLARENMDLKIHGDMLTVSGQKTEERTDADARYRFSERRFGRFERSFAIPPEVDRGQIKAKLRDGVLTIAMPKSGQKIDQSARVEIEG